VIFAGRLGVYVSKNKNDANKQLNLEEAATFFKKNKITEIFGDITKDQKKIFKPVKFVKQKESFGKTIEKLDLKALKPYKLVKPNYIKTPDITKSKRNMLI
jgi:hypothetical protein